MENTGIDFVITWVDGADKEWRAQKALFSPDTGTDDGEIRYRDLDLLRYWFRGVEKYAPWVRKIHFITWGHLPEWLNTEHPKLNIVRHENYIPAEYLPVFNSNVLEIYMHKIQDLSEEFVYFNDDFFLIDSVKEEDFFVEDKPRDMLAFQPVVANPANPVMSHLFMNNSLVLSKYFDKRENVRKHPGNYFKIGYPPLYFFYNLLELAFPLFTGFYTVHGPSAYCKSTFTEIWEKEEQALKKMSNNRFRSNTDLTPYLFREWQKLSNCFYPTNMHKHFQYFNLDLDNHKLVKTITTHKKKMICINDTDLGEDFDKAKNEIQLAFTQILPEVSSFER